MGLDPDGFEVSDVLHGHHPLGAGLRPQLLNGPVPGQGEEVLDVSVREGVNKKHAPKVLTPPPPVKLVFLCFNLL